VWGDRVFVTSQIGASELRPGNHPRLTQGPDADAGERPLGGARPAAADGKITLLVSAFHRVDGKLLWEYPFDAVGPFPQVHEKRNLATPSPVTDGERVYAWFSNGQIVAVDMNGKAAWSRHLGKEYGPFDLNWGHASSPALHGDKLILASFQGSTANLAALDKRTGKELWRVEREKGLTSYSTPVVIETGRGAELILNTSERVEAYDPASGKLLWSYKEQNRFPIPMPVYHNGILYLSRGYRSGPYMALKPGASGDVPSSNVVWRTPTGAPYVSSLVYYDGLIYMASELGIVTCIDAATGEHVWRERLGGFYSASPVAGDGKIYLVSETGETIVLRAGRKPEVLARNSLGEQTIASPAISGGQIYIRTDRNLYAIRAPNR
jgi:outer membrane protein assembly factor BamB